MLTAKLERHTILVAGIRHAHDLLGTRNDPAYERSIAALDLVLHGESHRCACYYLVFKPHRCTFCGRGSPDDHNFIPFAFQ
jgi:hypothetical protein